MADQYIDFDDPWTGGTLTLGDGSVTDDSIYLNPVDDWTSDYHGKLYFDVTKTTAEARSLRVYFLDLEEATISFENFSFTQNEQKTIEVQFPSEAHAIAIIRLTGGVENHNIFIISDIRSDIVHEPDIFWTGKTGVAEI